jgi:hypothetical protein
MSQSASLNLETVYGQLIAEHSPYERIIQRDLARTFPGIDMFKQEGGYGQQSLERVLKAYSLYDSLVGYCQGLAFLVGPLLLNVGQTNYLGSPFLPPFFLPFRCQNNKHFVYL